MIYIVYIYKYKISYKISVCPFKLAYYKKKVMIKIQLSAKFRIFIEPIRMGLRFIL